MAGERDYRAAGEAMSRPRLPPQFRRPRGRPRGRVSLDDVQSITLDVMSEAKAAGDRKTILEGAAELRQLALASQRLDPDSHDREAMLRQFSDQEIRDEYARRNLAQVIRVVYEDEDEAPPEVRQRRRAREAKLVAADHVLEKEEA